MIKRFWLICIIILIPYISPAQDTISYIYGTVVNQKENKLPDVNISLLNKSTLKIYRNTTDRNGNYRIDLPVGVYKLSAAKEGFVIYEKDFYEIKSPEILNITLTEKLYSTDEIDVYGNQKQSQKDLRTSLFNISPTNIKILPGGLEDVLRSLKSLPGISSPNDFTSQLVIRGSGPDQNLIIMDEVEIFNPYRLYGLVSMFNPETLADINLITGGFPAKYGDRLSAVLDVTNREGTTAKNIGFIGNVNIASANIIFQGKNPMRIPGSWIVSARRTYYDLILGPFAKKAGLITEDSSFPSFEDLQFKLAFGPFNKSKFVLNGIFSRDGVDIISGSERQQADSINAVDVTTNNVVSLGWHFIPNADFVSKTTIAWYQNTGDNSFDGDIIDPLIDKENLTPEQRDSLKLIGALLGFDFKSKYSFRKMSIGNRSVLNAGRNQFEFGAGFDIIRNDLTYALDLSQEFRNYLNSLPGAQALLEDFNIQGKDNYRASAYGQGRFEIADRFFYQPSIRVDYYSLLKKVYFSPRISLGYAINPLTTLRGSVGLYFQSPGYEKLVDNITFYDLTNPQIVDLKAERSTHFVLGLDRWLNNIWQVRVEGYYKKFDNLITQQRLTAYKYKYFLNDPNNTDPNYIKNPANWNRSNDKLAYDSVTAVPVNRGAGYAYGFEFSLEKKYAKADSRFYGWVNYSFSKAIRERYGNEAPFRFDQTHNVNVVLNYRFLEWLEVGIRWNYSSNFPFTNPIGITPRVVRDTIIVNPLTNQVIFNLDYGDESNRLRDRRPAYHRLDFRATAFTKFWGMDWSFYLDIINLYNRKNVLGYSYSINPDLSIKRKTTGMIPILPTIGVSARF